MKQFLRVFPACHLVISALFVACALALIGLAVARLWEGLSPLDLRSATDRLNAVLEGLAVLTVAVAALELGQTILEEEVQREAHMSAPTRVRRFLSRFLIVVIVSLSIETLVAVFRLLHDRPELLPQASTIGLATAALLAAWGVFIRLNRSAEELEPEAMAKAKSEDKALE